MKDDNRRLYKKNVYVEEKEKKNQSLKDDRLRVAERRRLSKEENPEENPEAIPLPADSDKGQTTEARGRIQGKQVKPNEIEKKKKEVEKKTTSRARR